MTKGNLIGLTAETPIHVGIGQASEALDLPVAREAITRFPHIPGSGVKGALRIWADGTALKPQADILFGTASGGDDGTDERAGTILCGEARLALLPIRCTSDAYKLVTCPMIINRLIRDLNRMQLPAPKITAQVHSGDYLGRRLDGETPLGLEEREFNHAGTLPDKLIDLLSPLMGDTFGSFDLASRIVVLSDADFKWFAEFGLPIATRNALDEHKIVKPGALWSEETLAPDTVMWMSLIERTKGALSNFKSAMVDAPYLQMGGNETIGQGWFALHLYGPSEATGGSDG